MSKKTGRKKRQELIEIRKANEVDITTETPLDRDPRSLRNHMRPPTPPSGRVTITAYLLAMWNLFWTAFVYPTKTTQIDLRTGKIVRHI